MEGEGKEGSMGMLRLRGDYGLYICSLDGGVYGFIVMGMNDSGYGYG